MTNNRPSRIIFDGGLEAITSELGVTTFLPQHAIRTELTPLDIEHEFNVRPILATQTHPSGRELITSFFTPEGGAAPDPFTPLESVHLASQVTSFRSLRYVLGALFYHLSQLAYTYADTWRSFHTILARQHGDSDFVNFVQYGLQEEGYYLFDALVTTGVRSYEGLRFPLGNAFGRRVGRANTGPRSNFEHTLAACDGLPPHLATRLSRGWLNFGTKAKAYRDFIQHYFPLDRGFAQAKMVRLTDDVWSTVMLIPDNPEDKSPSTFRYDLELDALTYGWLLTIEILTVTELVAREILSRE